MGIGILNPTLITWERLHTPKQLLYCYPYQLCGRDIRADGHMLPGVAVRIQACPCGIRRYRSTFDNLAFMEVTIQQAFLCWHHLMGVFFGIKAYDTNFCHFILLQLQDWEFQCHIPIFILSFLSPCHFRYQVGDVISDCRRTVSLRVVFYV